MLRLVLVFSLLFTLCLSSSAQTCSTFTSFSNNLAYSSCKDLPYLNSSIYWNYNSSSGSLQIAYRHAGITTSNWVAWAINPFGLQPAMIRAQALVAFQLSNGSMRVYTSQITSYTTTLPEDKLQYDVPDLTATYANADFIIYATLALPSNTTTINQVWQEGPVSNDNPGAHPLATANTNSKGTLDLISSPGPSRQPGTNSTAPNASASRSSGRMLTWVLLRFWLTMLCGWKLRHVMLF
ncbi:hypothetical protein SO802_007254 [Lithocarpus litseifolius]|uniref:DOMON domain-containing protein n=1 Tax=Lithocarpus litseifolius TaxID=425828 RepID=A0AAW2DNZ3_9ROSI